MKKSPVIIFKILLYFLIGCSESNSFDSENTNNKANYDIEIHYSDNSNRRKSENFNLLYSSDSLYLFFESGFKDDTASIFINGDLMTRTPLHSDYTGYADHYCIGEIRQIKHLAIRINNGNLALMEIKGKNLVNVNYLHNKLTLSVLDNVPFYH